MASPIERGTDPSANAALVLEGDSSSTASQGSSHIGVYVPLSVATRSKPAGLIVIGVVLASSALILVLIAIGLAFGDVLIIDNTPPTWLLVVGVAIGLTAAYIALRIAFGLFADPAKNRNATERAFWIGLLVVWLAMVGANLLLTGGQNDVAVWPVIALSGALWSAILIAAAVYMRSKGVRAYFAEIAP